MSDFQLMRKNMVYGQVLPSGTINPAIVEALLEAPREPFFPRQLSQIAYMDSDFLLQNNRYLLKSSTLARMLTALDPQKSDLILYVASGMGYGPAILGKLGAHVIALDSDEKMTQEAEKILQDLGLTHIKVVLGDLCDGWKGEKLYDKILVEGCIEFIPDQVVEQLKDRGTVVTFKQPEHSTMKCVKKMKKDGFLTETYLFDAFAPRLSSFKRDKPFIF